MNDAGWACCCYLLLENRTPADVAALVGGRLSDVVRPEHEADQESATRPAVGPAGPGWTVVVDPHFEFGDAQDLIAAWSAGTRAVRLMVIEREGFSHATAWADGAVRWDISYEEEMDDSPRIGGAFPFDAGDGYRAPIDAVRAVTGWQPRTADRLLLAELIYPLSFSRVARPARGA